MFDRTDVKILSDTVYVYDGSFDGLLCCVYYSYKLNEIACDIIADNNTLLNTRNIATDQALSNRVAAGIKKSGGAEVYSNCTHTFLSNLEGKELHILKYIRLALTFGKAVLGMLANTTVSVITKTLKNLFNERHRFISFIRFSIVDGALISTIEPKSRVLPLLAQHFINRYPNEKFMIYDKTHGMALMYTDKNASIVPIESYQMPPLDEQEIKFRQLWKMFYDTIEIKPRHNEKCRMGHMPKWYWKNMTEFMQ